MKHLSAEEIRDDMHEVLGEDAIKYSTVIKYLRQRSFPLVPCDTPDISPSKAINDAILDALEKQPFLSIRELAKLTCIPRTTIHRHLTKSFDFVLKHLRWVPHRLTHIQKNQRVELSKELLCQLRSMQHQGWQFIITFDESWFYLATDHEQMWLRPEQVPPERIKHTIQDKKSW
jgi:hypothetical protein